MLLLIRHGRAAAGIDEEDPGLDDLGRAQALATALALRDRGARRLAVSPLRRTRETATLIAAALGLSPEIRSEISEVFEPGLSFENRRALLDQLLAGRWSEQSAALKAWRARAVAAFVELAGHDGVAVSHFIAISAAIGAALDDDRVCAWSVPNASITALERGKRGLVLLEAGSVSHFGPELLSHGTPLLGRGATDGAK